MVTRKRIQTTTGDPGAVDERLTHRYGRPFPHVVKEARRRADEADATLRLVEAQTVFALVKANWSVRDTEDVTGISKSEVGRLRKALVDENGHLHDGWLDIDDVTAGAVARNVGLLWSDS